MSDEAEFRAEEFRYVTRTLEALYDRLKGGESSEVLRARVARWEAVQQALCGFPEVLSR